VSTLKIHIGHDFFGAGNIGDDLTLGGFLCACAQFGHSVSITCCSPHPLGPLRRRFPEVAWFPANYEERSARIQNCDLWLGLGDSPFQSVVGTAILDHIVEDLRICRDRNKPVFFLGVGVNDEEALELPQTIEILRAAEHIWTRDRISARQLSNLVPENKLTEGADLSNLFLSRGCRQSRHEGRGLGVVINVENPQQVSIGIIGSVLLGWTDDRLVWLCQEVRNLPFSELSYYSQLDEPVQSRVALVIPDYDQGSLVDFTSTWKRIGTCLSTRYHAALVAAWAGCRIAIFPRSQKVVSLIHDIGCVSVNSLGCKEDIVGALEEAKPVEPDRLRALESLAQEKCQEFLQCQ
jgi:polysaccharide pyruvyl transferase WcaK-like protein